MKRRNFFRSLTLSGVGVALSPATNIADAIHLLIIREYRLLAPNIWMQPERKIAVILVSDRSDNS